MIFLSILSILIGSLLSSGAAPTEAELSGEWKYSDSIFVFGEESGKTPSLKDVEDRMTIMGVTADKCSITFHDGGKCTLALGPASLDLKWDLDKTSKVFKVSMGPIAVKGNLVKRGDKIVLIYPKNTLFLIMRYLNAPADKKHVNYLDKELDCCKGLTLGLEFAK